MKKALILLLLLASGCCNKEYKTDKRKRLDYLTKLYECISYCDDNYTLDSCKSMCINGTLEKEIK